MFDLNEKAYFIEWYVSEPSAATHVKSVKSLPVRTHFLQSLLAFQVGTDTLQQTVSFGFHMVSDISVAPEVDGKRIQTF